MKIIVKVPDEKVNKFRLQCRGLEWVGRRFLTASGLLNTLERSFSLKNLRKKPSIVVKRYLGSHFEELNESLRSDNKEYLLHCTACFLEEYLSQGTLKKYEKSLHI